MKARILPALTLLVTAFALIAHEPKGPPPGGFGQGGQKGPPGQKGGFGGQGGGQGGQFGGGGGEGFRPPQHPLELALDANNDGVIDAKELANAVAVLKRLDRNGDSRLTDDEFRPMRPGGGGFGGQGGGPGGPGGFGGQQGGKGFGGPQGKDGKGQGGFGGEPGGPEGQKGGGGPASKSDGDFVSRLFQNDKNNDGKLTKAELPEGLQAIFERGDTNKDGVIDRQEAGVLAERMKSRGGGQGTDGKRPSPEK
jgi:hypothetical protein